MSINHTSKTVDILELDQRTRARDLRQRVASTAIGVALTGVSVFRARSLARVLFGTAGVVLIARGVSGLGLKQLSNVVKGLLFAPRADLVRRFNDGEHDIVDAASFDSFPASDPPSYSPGVG